MRSAKRVLTGLAACLLVLTACGDEQLATGRASAKIADLEPRDEAAVRASLAALDPCALLAAAQIDATLGPPHACSVGGNSDVQLSLGVELTGHADDELITVNDTYAVEVGGSPCRILVPSSRKTGLEVVAADCEEARSNTAAVIDRLNSGDAAILPPPAAHDACTLLASLVPVVESRLHSIGLDRCSVSDESESDIPSGLSDGTTLTLWPTAQSPRDMLRGRPGASLVTVAGQPVVIADVDGGGCQASARLEKPVREGKPFAVPTTWAEVYSSTEQCDSLLRSAGAVVRAAAKPPMTPNPEYMSYPATDVQD